MKIQNINNISVAILDMNEKINGVQDMLDIMGTAQYNGCIGIVVYKECLGEMFFDLKTGYAGEILQKFSNYNMKTAIIGDFSSYKSKSLRDFIFECNKGNRVFFKSSPEEGLNALLN